MLNAKVQNFIPCVLKCQIDIHPSYFVLFRENENPRVQLFWLQRKVEKNDTKLSCGSLKADRNLKQMAR